MSDGRGMLTPMTNESAPQLAPITVVTGTEELLVERAVRRLIRQSGDDQVEVHDRDVVAVKTGELGVLTSPSLFGGPPVVVLRGIESLVQSNDAVAEAVDEVMSYLKSPATDACVLLVHGGGNGGKAVLTAAKKAGAVQENTPTLKKAGEIRQHRRQFVKEEFRAAGCTITPQAVETLVEAVGTNLRDLAGACSQLAADKQEGKLDESDVLRYYGGRAEVRTFDVADRIVAGHTAEGLGLYRHARESGTPLVLFPAAMARTLRQVAWVATAPRGASATDIANATDMPEWKVKSVRDVARHWSEAGLVAAIRAVAEADAAIKGGGEADADYALERMLITVGRCRTRAA